MHKFANRYKKDLSAFNSLDVTVEAKNICSKYSNINAVNIHAYPELEHIKNECSAFIKDLVYADKNTIVLPTSGSSEAILIKLTELRQKYSGSINIIVGESGHVSWLHIATLLGIEVKIAKTNKDGILDVDSVKDNIDINTKIVVATLGSPITLKFDNVYNLNTLLNDFVGVEIHVDAAIGGFIAPFIDFPAWDFRLSNVTSINISAHKYGIVNPALGFLAYKGMHILNSKHNYFGKSMSHYPIRFSHSFVPMLQLHSNIKYFGVDGYASIVRTYYALMDEAHNILKSECDLAYDFSKNNQLPGLVYKRNDSGLINKLISSGWNIAIYEAPGIEGYVFRLVFKYGLKNIELLQLLQATQCEYI